MSSTITSMSGVQQPHDGGSRGIGDGHFTVDLAAPDVIGVVSQRSEQQQQTTSLGHGHTSLQCVNDDASSDDVIKIEHAIVEANNRLTIGQCRKLLKELSDDQRHIKRELECPVCFKVMEPPIFSCEVGHSLCGDCKPRLKACPKCQGALTTARSYVAESITQHLTYPCRFPGCKSFTKLSKRKSHEADCLQRTFKCPIAHCPWKGPIVDLRQHLLMAPANSRHTVKELPQDKASFSFRFPLSTLRNNSSALGFLSAFGKLFWLTLSGREGYYFACLRMLDGKSECESVRFNLSVQSTNSDFKYQIDGKVHYDRDDPDSSCIPLPSYRWLKDKEFVRDIGTPQEFMLVTVKIISNQQQQQLQLAVDDVDPVNMTMTIGESGGRRNADQHMHSANAAIESANSRLQSPFAVTRY